MKLSELTASKYASKSAALQATKKYGKSKKAFAVFKDGSSMWEGANGKLHATVLNAPLATETGYSITVLN